MTHALWWWLAVQVISLCATPLCLALFRPLADGGYGLSKAFGLLLFAYAVWLLGVLHLVPNSSVAYIVALVLIGGGSYLAWRRGRAAMLTLWRRRRGLLLLEEAIFLAAFLGFLFIRAFNADIAGTEKFMDFAFMNAVTRSTFFPPLDPWLAPSPSIPTPTINYYHFGYLIQGLLLAVTGVPRAVGYNLALGLLFGLTATGAFGLVYSLARDVAADFGTRRLVRSSTRASAAPGTGRSPLPPGAGSEQRTPLPVEPSRAGGSPRYMGERAGGRSSRPTPSWSLKAAAPYVGCGLLGVYLLLMAGNLWTALQPFNGAGLWGKDFWQGVGWNATRVLVIRQGERDIDYTINEFPSFSFLLGDLHPHVLALPFVVLAVSLAYSWLMAPPRLFQQAFGLLDDASDDVSPASAALAARSAPGAWVTPVLELLPGALILGSLYFLNSWDFPAYFVLAQVAALAGAWWLWRRAVHDLERAADGPLVEHAEPSLGEPAVEEVIVLPWSSWLRGGAVAVLVGMLAVGLFLPFHLTFKLPVIAEGGGLPLGLVTQRSQFGQFFQFWGVQLLALIPITAVALLATGTVPFAHQAVSGSLTRARSTAVVLREVAGWELALLAGGALLAGMIAEGFGSGALLLSLLLAGAAGFVAVRFLQPVTSEIDAGGRAVSRVGTSSRALAFAFGAVCLGALLLATCEVVYIRDFYGGALRRMNTVFKLYYQAWLLFALSGSVLVFWLFRFVRRASSEGRGLFGACAAVGVVLLGATVFFPYKVTLLRTNSFQNPATLDGMDWMRRFHPDDYAAAQWLDAQGANGASPAPVILEATGGAYSEFSRMSTQTGLPTVLGWDQHERLWRGAQINGEVDLRRRDVDAIYTAGTVSEVQPLLDKYRITYLIVGYLEEQKYGASGGLAKFEQEAGPDGPLQVAFRQGKTTIYRVRT